MSNAVYVYDPAQGKVVKREDRWVEAGPQSAYVINDEMPLTKSPINGKLYFSSKRALRAHYRQHGFEEVGTSYENEEYIEKAEREYQEDKERSLDRKIKQDLIDRVIHGKR